MKFGRERSWRRREKEGEFQEVRYSLYGKALAPAWSLGFRFPRQSLDQPRILGMTFP